MVELEELKDEFTTIGVAAQAVVNKLSGNPRSVQMRGQFILMSQRLFDGHGARTVIVAIADDWVVVDTGARAWLRRRQRGG